MNVSCGFVELRELDWDDLTFAVRSFRPDPWLEASLDRYGLLSAPWVWRKESHRVTVVDGFKRLRWAGDKKLQGVECAVFPGGSDAGELMLKRLERKLFGRPLNIAEKAQIISKLAQIIPQERIVSEFLPLLDISSRPEVIEMWRRLADAGEALLQAAASEEICDRAALEVMGWEEEARREILRLLKELKCSASIQMEILERAEEIALREGAKGIEVLREPELQSILHDSGRNHRQKTQSVREFLARRRFPRLQARVERFARELAQASLPKTVRLMHPPAFEGERWSLQVSFSSPRELQTRLEEAGSFARSPELEVLMSPQAAGVEAIPKGDDGGCRG